MPRLIAGVYRAGKKTGEYRRGVIYQGLNTRTNKVVDLYAEKSLPGITREKEREIARIRRSIRHGNIPELLDAATEGNILISVYEHLDGMSLNDRMRKNPKPTRAELMRWICQILDALKYLHSRPPKGIAHGHISTEEIFITTDGRAMLMGLDLASIRDSADRRTDTRRDLFDLGLVMDEVLGDCNPFIREIIDRALDVSTKNRYREAWEMLRDLTNVSHRDPEYVSFNARRKKYYGIVIAVLLAGCVMTALGYSQTMLEKEAAYLGSQASLSLEEGDVSRALDSAREGIRTKHRMILPSPENEALSVLIRVLGIYDLTDGYHLHAGIEVAAGPSGIVISPDETRIAVRYMERVAVFDAETLEKKLDTPVDDGRFFFLSEDRVIYAAEDQITAFDMSDQSVIWQTDSTGDMVLSGDRSVLAVIDEAGGQLLMMDAATGELRHSAEPDPTVLSDSGAKLTAINTDGSRIALCPGEGGMFIINTADGKTVADIYDMSGCEQAEGVFTGRFFVHTGIRGDRYMKGVLDAEKGIKVSVRESADKCFIKKDGDTACIVSGSSVSTIDAVSGTEKDVITDLQSAAVDMAARDGLIVMLTRDHEIVTYRRDTEEYGSFPGSAGDASMIGLCGDMAVLGSASRPVIRLLQKKDNTGTGFFVYDGDYVHSQTRLDRDGLRAMLYGRDGFRIYTSKGELVKEVFFPDAERIRKKSFYRGEMGSYLEVTWNDGSVRNYSASTGELISEGERETAAVLSRFDRDESDPEESGAVVSDALRSGEYRVFLYDRDDGTCSGALYDKDGVRIVPLPGLCDVTEEGNLIFDYGMGDLRYCSLYTASELLDMEP